MPVTGTPAQGVLYPSLAPGSSVLTKPSTAPVDQVRSIDKQRVRRRYGRVSSAELETIDAGVACTRALKQSRDQDRVDGRQPGRALASGDSDGCPGAQRSALITAEHTCWPSRCSP